MKKRLLFLFLITFFYACSSQKQVVQQLKPVLKTDRIIANAKKYLGVKYKFGGTTSKGMDCSGVIYIAFKTENILLPRVSRDMAKKGKAISLSKAKKGDLIFFKTNKSSRRINHVGLITSAKNGIVQFLHATTSKGVIISNLNQTYWKSAYVKTVKVL